MGKYTNPVDITSGRRLHIAQPMDDRVVFDDLNDIITDIGLGRTTAWYSGLVTHVQELHNLYVWRLSDNVANNGHPEETNPNPNVDYTSALMPSDFRYDPGFPNSGYAGYYFNWYPYPTGGVYTNTEAISATNLEGWPEGTIPGTKTFQTMWDTLLYPYIAPLITLSGGPSPGYYEKGYIIDNTTLNGMTTKKKLDITIVEFFREGSSIHIENNPNPNGGNEIFIEIDDVGLGVNPSDVDFKATVTDGQILVTSNTIRYRFVYPMYVGYLIYSSPNESQIKTLTKVIRPKETVNHIFNMTQERYVFAFPQSYGVLNHIYDTNGFETIDDYEVTRVNFTMLDGATVPYYIYTFKALTDANNFTNSYQF